jgi:hypothetical protein
MTDRELPPLQSRAAFSAAVHWCVAQASAGGAHRLVFIDPDFADWPLDDPELLDALGAWLRQPERRLVLLAHRFEELIRGRPRFVAWRRSYAHAVEPRSPSDDQAPELPTLVIDDGQLCLHLIDKRLWRGRVTLEARRARVWRDRIDAILQRSEPRFPATTLGL